LLLYNEEDIQRRFYSQWATLAVLALIYFVAGKFGLRLAFMLLPI
jgi:hypothetical protein